MENTTCSLGREFLHGADYNPEQWLNEPGILDEDFRLLKLAGMNSITLGVFSWALLEPKEGHYVFDWMDDIFERAAQADIKVILATPSGGKPNWLALRYPEVRRINRNGVREPQAIRQNHCPTSPIYREKVKAINTRLAERYGHHPALALWHISNEFSGYCYCPLCMEAFRGWLKERYNDIGKLNEAYWAAFWSHTYSDWSEIQYIDETVHGLHLDWRRFMTSRCADFIRREAEPIRQFSPGIPITTNFHQTDSYDYFSLAGELDVISWDSYPRWHQEGSAGDERSTAAETAMRHDMHRCMKNGQPFLLMETTPSQTNWFGISPLLRPGMHRLNALLAIAHGADSICYFQFRQSRGSSEKYHGAVVSHAGHERTRVFREVSALGDTLPQLQPLVGVRSDSAVAVVFDWENMWAIEQAQTPQNPGKQYRETCLAHYRPFWDRGIPVDVIDSKADFTRYRLVITPMLHMLREGVAEKLAQFVEEGGTWVATYQTGYVNESDLCFLGGYPGPLRKILGIWVEEFDALPESRSCSVVPEAACAGLSGSYQAGVYADLLHAESAEVLATYGSEFYAGLPALTVNRYGMGRAYYIASRNDARFQQDFCARLCEELSLQSPLPTRSPEGIVVRSRSAGGQTFLFVLNLLSQPGSLMLPEGVYRDAENGKPAEPCVALGPYASRVFFRETE